MAKKNQCDKCTGLCCRYFALPIETPEEKADYDDIRWYLCHKDINVFVEDGDWAEYTIKGREFADSTATGTVTMSKANTTSTSISQTTNKWKNT